MSSARATRSRGAWTSGQVPGSEVVALVCALLLTVAVVDIALSGRIGLLFDLAFVSLAAAAGVGVRHGDFFGVGVLPPLAMLAVVALLAIADPGAVAEADDGFVQATVTGVSVHAVALLVGYALCLAELAWRAQAHASAR
jgi:hypothetical protein